MAAPSPATIVARLSVSGKGGTLRMRAGPSLTSTVTNAPQSGHLTSLISLRSITASASFSCVGAAQEVEHFADGSLSVGRLAERKVVLDLVAITAAIAFFHDVFGIGEVGDDAIGAAFCDSERAGDVPQARAGVVRDAQHHPCVVGEEAPFRHTSTLPELF
jgi:hypothetical protein